MLTGNNGCIWDGADVGDTTAADVDAVGGATGGGKLKLFCDVIFRDFTSGGFLIDDEKANPLRSVALKLHWDSGLYNTNLEYGLLE